MKCIMSYNPHDYHPGIIPILRMRKLKQVEVTRFAQNHTARMYPSWGWAPGPSASNGNECSESHPNTLQKEVPRMPSRLCRACGPLSSEPGILTLTLRELGCTQGLELQVGSRGVSSFGRLWKIQTKETSLELAIQPLNSKILFL